MKPPLEILAAVWLLNGAMECNECCGPVEIGYNAAFDCLTIRHPQWCEAARDPLGPVAAEFTAFVLDEIARFAVLADYGSPNAVHVVAGVS